MPRYIYYEHVSSILNRCSIEDHRSGSFDRVYFKRKEMLKCTMNHLI